MPGGPFVVTTQQRHAAWERAGRTCARCATPLKVSKVRIDYLDDAVWRARGNRAPENFRCLCHRCHTLRAENIAHGRVDIDLALTAGLIPANYRALIWDDEPDAL